MISRLRMHVRLTCDYEWLPETLAARHWVGASAAAPIIETPKCITGSKRLDVLIALARQVYLLGSDSRTGRQCGYDGSQDGERRVAWHRIPLLWRSLAFERASEHNLRHAEPLTQDATGVSKESLC
jgi:hypothetical protein